MGGNPSDRCGRPSARRTWRGVVTWGAGGARRLTFSISWRGARRDGSSSASGSVVSLRGSGGDSRSCRRDERGAPMRGSWPRSRLLDFGGRIPELGRVPQGGGSDVHPDTRIVVTGGSGFLGRH